MNILETIVQLRDDLKAWVTNNLNALNAKIEANTVPIDSELSSTSTNPVQNKAVSEEINSLNKLVNDVPEQIAIAIAAIPEENPNIIDDESGEFNIADNNGNVIFKADSDGIHTTTVQANEVKINGQDVIDMINNYTIAVDDALDDTSTNPVQNKVISAEIESLNNRVGSTSVEAQISEAIGKQEHFSGDFNDLTNAPNIKEDDAGNMVVADESGNIIFQVDGDGINTTGIKIDNIDIFDMLNVDTNYGENNNYAPVRSILDNGVVSIEQKSGDVTLTKINSYTYNLDFSYTSSKIEFLLGQVRYYDYDYGLSVAGLPDIDTVRIESRPWDSDSVYTFYNSDIISRDTQPKWEIDFNKKIHDIYLVIDGGVSGKDTTIAGVICRNERTYDRLLQISNENADIKYVPNLYFNGSLENYKLYPGDLTSVYPTSEFTIGDSTGVTFIREFSEEDNSFVLIVNGTAANDFYYPIYEIMFNKERGGITFYGNHESVFGPNPYYNSDKLDEIYPFTFTNNMYTLHGGNMPYNIDKSTNGDNGLFDHYETGYFIGCLYVAIKKGETFNSTRLEYNYYPSTSTGDLLQHHHVDISYLSDSVFENRATYSNVNSFVIAAEDSTEITNSNGEVATFTNNGDNTFTVVSNMEHSSDNEAYNFKFLIGSYTFEDIPYGYVITGIPENLRQWSEKGKDPHLLIEAEDGSGRIETINYNGITGKIHLKTNDIDGFEAYNSDWYAVKGKTANIYIAQRSRYSSPVDETFDFSNFKIDKCVSSHEVMKKHSDDIEDLKNRLNSGVVGGSGDGTTVDLSNYATKKDVTDAIDGISFPVTKVNNKTGNITLTASDVGALASNGKAADATKADYATSAGTAEDASKLGGTDADKYATKEFVTDEIGKAQLSGGGNTSIDLSKYITEDDLEEITVGNSERLNDQTFHKESASSSPDYVWGGMFETPDDVYAHLTSSLSVGHAESAGYADSAGSKLNGQTYHNEVAEGSPDYVWGGMFNTLEDVYAHAVSEFSVKTASELVIPLDSLYNSVSELPSKGTPGKVYFVKR